MEIDCVMNGWFGEKTREEVVPKQEATKNGCHCCVQSLEFPFRFWFWEVLCPIIVFRQSSASSSNVLTNPSTLPTFHLYPSSLSLSFCIISPPGPWCRFLPPLTSSLHLHRPTFFPPPVSSTYFHTPSQPQHFPTFSPLIFIPALIWLIWHFFCISFHLLFPWLLLSFSPSHRVEFV